MGDLLEIKTPRLVIAGTRSGDGKTTIASGIMAAFGGRGLKVQGFKVGPDYIDPTYHYAATGESSYNLDGWMTCERYLKERFALACRGKDLAVVEGAMGLFDGHAASPEQGSTAQVAKWLGAPVALIIDASGLGASAAAMASGYCGFDPEIDLSAIIFNKVGGRSHLELLTKAVASSVGAKLIGGLPRDGAMSLPSRHLGLMAARETLASERFLERLSSFVEESLDLDLLLEIASSSKPLSFETVENRALPQRRCNVALARDEAFYFYYQDNLELLQEAGAHLVPFSPLRDRSLPQDISGIYIGGGYPELFARDLEDNRSMRNEIKEFAEAGGAIYAECGGLMYLLGEIETISGERRAMAGVLPGRAKMCGNRRALGYVEVEVREPNLLAPQGAIFRGHEFHYSEIIGVPEKYEGVKLTYLIKKGSAFRLEGYSRKNVLGSYVHAHFGSNAELAGNFLKKCQKASRW